MAHEFGGLADPAVNLPVVQLHVFGSECDVLIHRLLKELVLRVLEYQAHLEAGLAGALLALPDILPLKENPAGGGLQKAVQMLDQGGFSRPGVTDNAQVLPPVGGEVHVDQGEALEGSARRIGVTEFFRLDDRLHSSRILYD